MTVEINGFEINLDNVLYVTPIFESGTDVCRFYINFSGKGSEPLFFTTNHGGSQNFPTQYDLTVARQKIIDKLNGI